MSRFSDIYCSINVLLNIFPTHIFIRLLISMSVSYTNIMQDWSQLVSTWSIQQEKRQWQ